MILDQSFVPPPGQNLTAFINEGFDLAAQTFTTGLCKTLDGVRVAIRPATGTAPLRLSIYEMSGGAPTSNFLGSVTLATTMSDLSQLVTIPQTINLVAGTQYALAADSPGPPRGRGQVQGFWDRRAGTSTQAASRSTGNSRPAIAGR